MAVEQMGWWGRGEEGDGGEDIAWEGGGEDGGDGGPILRSEGRKGSCGLNRGGLDE